MNKLESILIEIAFRLLFIIIGIGGAIVILLLLTLCATFTPIALIGAFLYIIFNPNKLA
jgi:hypothetical protein